MKALSPFFAYFALFSGSFYFLQAYDPPLAATQGRPKGAYLPNAVSRLFLSYLA
jgi:hypothetical protein